MSYEPRLGLPGTGVIVTGGASGLGRASAEALAAVGRAVSLWDLEAEKAASAAKEIAQRYGVVAQGLAVDVRDPAALEDGVERARHALPSLGGLVHAAGVCDVESLDGLTPEAFDDGIRIHTRPLALLAKLLLPFLREQTGSAIVTFSSINATLGNATNPIYSAGKAGALGLMRSLADRLARDGIRINAVSPGQIDTPMMQPSLEALGAVHFTRRILMERVGEPAEVARVVRFLLSEEASYVTAAEIVIDGGNLSSQRT